MPPLRRSRVLHRPQRLPVRVRPLVQYRYGIRRRLQHLNKASGRGWGLVGRPSGLRATRQRHLRSNLGFLPRSRRQPHPVCRIRRLCSRVRVLRPGSRLVRRCSRGPLERRLGASLEHLLVRPLQRPPVWRPQQRLRFVRRHQPDSLARRPLSPVRPGGPTGRTPAGPSGPAGPPVAPPGGPQARMPAGPAAPPTRTPGPPMQPRSSGANPGA